jgi:hypothetical protein
MALRRWLMGILDFAGIGNGVDIAADGTTGECQGIEKAFAAGGVDGIVDGVVTDGAGDGTGDDAFESAGASDTPVLQLGKQQLGSVVVGRDIRAREAVSNAHTGKGVTLQRITGKGGKTGAVLVIVLDVFGIDADGLTGDQSGLLRLVVFVQRGKDGEAGRNRAVEQIGLGETENDVALVLANLGGDG